MHFCYFVDTTIRLIGIEINSAVADHLLSLIIASITWKSLEVKCVVPYIIAATAAEPICNMRQRPMFHPDHEQVTSTLRRRLPSNLTGRWRWLKTRGSGSVNDYKLGARSVPIPGLIQQ